MLRPTFRHPWIVALIFITLWAVSAAGVTAAGTRAAQDSRIQPAGERSTSSAVFPLRVLRGKRYLATAGGKPFLLVGDAAWSLMVQLKDDEVDRYLQDRRRKGFTAVLVNLVEHLFSDNPPLDAYGDAPFTTPGDFSTPNKRYFDHVATVIAKARAQGILVLLTPAYPGNGGGAEGWWQEMRASGAQKLRQFGRFVGARYRGFDNVLWVEGGDFDPPQNERNLVEAVAAGIRSMDQKLQTFHGSRYTSALGYWHPKPAWLGVNTVYADYPTILPYTSEEYRRSTTPFFMIEGTYENEASIGGAGVRQQAYQPMLLGATGSVMGNTPIWRFGQGWENALDSAGSKSMTTLAAFFHSIRWWKLRPDLRNEFLVTMTGNGPTASVAARASDGSFAVVYTPVSRPLTIDLSKLRGRFVRARWYDPVSGRFRSVAGSPFRNTSRRTFTSPATNAGGDHDFLLLLQSP